MRTILSTISGFILLAGAAFPSSAAETLTVYTYESFTADWGPGPQIEKTFEAECECDLNFVSVADGVALLNRVKLEGADTRADIVLGLDTNLVTEAKATGLFAPHGLTSPETSVPGGWRDDVFVPFDYGYFAVIYDTQVVASPPKSLADLVDGESDTKIVIQDPPHLDTGSRPAFVDEIGLWRWCRGRLGPAFRPGPHGHAGLGRILRSFHQRRSTDGPVLHHVAGLSHDRRKLRALSGRRVRGGSLPADRGCRPDEKRALTIRSPRPSWIS